MSDVVHGAAVLVRTYGVLIRGVSGGGKSSLAARLIERGGRLVADDRVHLSVCHGRILAAPVAPIGGLIELRGRGIECIPHERGAVIRLVVDILSGGALERMPESNHLLTRILEIELPRQPVAAKSEAMVPLVEAALRALSQDSNTGLRSARLWG
jgi:serine kinase of HPr protein (carbohydrate metabolism regulator)